jgi:Domain of unknown function (DUF5916)
MKYKYLAALFYCFIFYFIGQAQQKKVKVKWIDTPIKIDGNLDDEAWRLVEPAKNFWQYFPLDSVHAKYDTEIYMAFDAKTLYIGIKLYAKGNDYIIPSYRRDFRARGNDNISLIFDTFNDGSNAFFFGTNPYGVRREALISGGGTNIRGFNTSWDIKWEGTSKIYDGYSISEMAIPFSAFKYRDGETVWHFNSYRFDTQYNEQSTWMRIPKNQFIFSLAFMGEMEFERPLPKSKTPIYLIPYVNANSSNDFINDNKLTKLSFGGDVKVPIGNSMNLDLTLNPDFSQVEVDDQIVNLTRFEISLPEKRQFFIDNSDLFADFGDAREANPFFSRRIGVASDLSGRSIENKLVGGFRLSGKLNESLRLGLLNIQTDEDAVNQINANNNTVLALQQKVFARSNIGFIFINRQNTSSDATYLTAGDNYNRVIGLDYKLASASNKWVGNFYTHKSFTPGKGSKNLSSGANLLYNTRKNKIGFGSLYIGGDFNSDLGFIRRKDILRLSGNFEHVYYPQKGPFDTHRYTIRGNKIFKPNRDFLNSDYDYSITWSAVFKDQSQLSAGAKNNYIYLFRNFEPTGRKGAIALPSNVGYQYTNFELTYSSDRRKVFSYNLRGTFGQFFNGNRYGMVANLNLRKQPILAASILINYNYISLPKPYATSPIWLIGPKTDITFNKNLYWSTFIQYTSQSENIGINSRLQWRFKPLSDLFIVYNDNYRTTDFSPRTRALIFKFTYWLNI